METKGVTCKIPLELHNQISEEIRETESTMSKFIEMVIREHYEKGANKIMEKGRTFVITPISLPRLRILMAKPASRVWRK